MDPHARIVVVGGGIFGVSVALALAERGHARVELVERGRLGAASTALAAGIVSLQTWNEEDAQLILRTRRRIQDLAAWGRESGLPAAGALWRPVGAVTVAPPGRRPDLERMRAGMARLGARADLYDGAEAERVFPSLRFAPDEAVLHGPEDGHVAPTDLVDLARRRARALGVHVREDVAVERIDTDRGAVAGLTLAGGGRARADAVVVAGGAWTRGLLARSGVPLPALAYRTQLCSLDSVQPPSVVVHDAVHGFYARPDSERRFLAGDGTQLWPFDPDAYDAAPDPSFLESIAAAVPARVRGDDIRYVNGWAGLCVGTPDRRPLAGPLPAVTGLHVLTGDNGFGVMRGLALGEVVAARLDRASDPQAVGVDPARFGTEPPADFALGEGFTLA